MIELAFNVIALLTVSIGGVTLLTTIGVIVISARVWRELRKRFKSAMVVA